jgi:hypothetical protein
MIDMQLVAGLSARDPGKHGVPPEPLGPNRKPRTGRYDPSADRTALDQLPEARLDENPVLGLRRARI